MSEFVTFVNNELNNRGWSSNELGRRANISSGGVSLVLTGSRNPGADFCVKIARAFGVQPEFTLRLAGILPPVPEAVQNESEMLTVYRQLNDDHRRAVLAAAHALRELETDRKMGKRPHG